jgi:hypothetical protein
MSRILAVENQGIGERAARLHALANLPDSAVKIVGGAAGIHAAVDEAYQVG